jgi:hypothetical protein
MSAERLAGMIKVAILDNSLDPDVYKPVLHWSRWLTEAWIAFRAPEGRFPRLGDRFTHLILTGSEASIGVEDGRNLLKAEFERSYKGAEMLELALRSVPRDTEFIHSIVPAFLGA